MIHDYEIIESIGEGSYGKVYLGLLNGNKYTIKEVEVNDTKTLIFYMNEVNVLSYLKLLVDHFNIGTKKYIVYNFINGDNLWNLRYDIKSWTEIFIQISKVIKNLHDLGISHNDIKPQNFISNDSGVYLIDYSHCCTSKQSEILLCKTDYPRGAKIFAAPEYYINQNFNHFLSDIYSIGVTFYVCISKTLPYFGNSNLIDQIIDTNTYPEPLPDTIVPILNQLIFKMMQKNPKHRPSLNTVISILQSLK